MYDTMQNAPAVDDAAIIKRQFYLGGINLADTANAPEWKRPWAVERYKFVELFYRYCRAQIANRFAVSFSDWRSSRLPNLKRRHARRARSHVLHT